MLVIIESSVNQICSVARLLHFFWGILVDNGWWIFWVHSDKVCLIHQLDSVTDSTMGQSRAQHWSERAQYWFERDRKVTWSHFRTVTGPEINCTNSCSYTVHGPVATIKEKTEVTCSWEKIAAILLLFALRWSPFCWYVDFCPCDLFLVCLNSWFLCFIQMCLNKVCCLFPNPAFCVLSALGSSPWLTKCDPLAEFLTTPLDRIGTFLLKLLASWHGLVSSAQSAWFWWGFKSRHWEVCLG